MYIYGHNLRTVKIVLENTSMVREGIWTIYTADVTADEP